MSRELTWCCMPSLATLNGHTLPVSGWTPFQLQNLLNSSWHKFNKMLETFLRDSTAVTEVKTSQTSQPFFPSLLWSSANCHHSFLFSVHEWYLLLL